MRPSAPASAFFTLGLFVWGCSVYDTGLLESGGSLSGTGNTGADDGKGGMATGGSSSSGGKANTGAGKGSTEAGTSNSAGTAAVEGGAPTTEEGGAGGDVMSGAGGIAGTSAGGGGSANAGTSGSGGSSGSGGGGNAVKCSEHPLNPKTEWKASASHESKGNGMESDGLYNPPFHAIDGITGERWSTGKPQSGNEWFEIDFGQEVTVTQVTLQTFNNDVEDWPRMYAVRFTDMSMNFLATAIVSGSGTTGSTVINLPEPTTGQFLLIRQTGSVDPLTKWWTIGEVVVTCTD